jgi:uncharacterized protein YdeI (BOF family)
MKKILLLTIMLFMVTVTFAKQGNPIPSYNVSLSGKAIFQEDNSGSIALNNHPSYEKRDMNVTDGGNSNGPVGGSPVVVYFYRLDRTIVLGPYYLTAGQTMTVPIDNNPWGVSTISDSQTIVSVWADGSPQ